jgi:hypothetical protein
MAVKRAALDAARRALGSAGYERLRGRALSSWMRR